MFIIVYQVNVCLLASPSYINRIDFGLDFDKYDVYLTYINYLIYLLYN